MQVLRRATVLVALALLVGAGLASAGTDAAPSTPAEVFAKLKTLAGSWSGEAVGEGQSFTAAHEFRVTAAGSVVMEVMNEGTDHEMINMYHLAGEDLVVTHYCAGANQPLMKLDAEALASGRLQFGFAGGTNLDPAKDAHIHSAAYHTLEPDQVESEWTSWEGGRQMSTMRFRLTRQD